VRLPSSGAPSTPSSPSSRGVRSSGALVRGAGTPPRILEFGTGRLSVELEQTDTGLADPAEWAAAAAFVCLGAG